MKMLRWWARKQGASSVCVACRPALTHVSTRQPHHTSSYSIMQARSWPLLLLVVGCAAACYIATLVQFHSPANSNESAQSLIRHQAMRINQLQDMVTKGDEARALAREQATQIAQLHKTLDQLQQLRPTPTPALTMPTPSQGAQDKAPVTFGSDENFLLATRTEVHDAVEARRVLRALLAIAWMLNRTLILPTGDVLMAAQTAAELGHLGLRTRTAAFMSGELPAALKCSHLRILTPEGLDSEQLTHALRHYSSTRILEVNQPHRSYCGQSPRAVCTSSEQGRAPTRAILSRIEPLGELLAERRAFEPRPCADQRLGSGRGGL